MRCNICIKYKSLWKRINKLLFMYDDVCIYCNKNLYKNNMINHINKECNERKNKLELELF